MGNHIVFVRGGDKIAADLATGDTLFIAGESGAVASKVLAVTQDSRHVGMFAPLTPSGTIVVDNVIASNYGSFASHFSPSHSAFHAALFPVRFLHVLELSSLLGSPTTKKSET